MEKCVYMFEYMMKALFFSNISVRLLAETSCSVAHCPNSNTSIRSGRMDVRKMKRAGIKAS